MALKIIDARKSGFPHDGHFGYVHLVFDRDIDADPLKLSILKMIGREYLGESYPPKANWRPTRWHFFDAPMVARGDGETVFVLGPEVTSFIPDESMLEIASEDNSVRELAVWSGVSVDFSWKGPAPEAAPVRQTPPVSSSTPRPIVREPSAMPEPPPAPPPPPPEPSPPTAASPAPEAPPETPPLAPSTGRMALSPFAWVRRGKPDTPAEPPPVPTREPEPAAEASSPPELPAEPEPETQEIPDAPPLSLAEPVEQPDTPAEPPSLPERDALVSAPPEVPVEPAQEAEAPPLPPDETAGASAPSADNVPAFEPQPETGSTSDTEPAPRVPDRSRRVAWAVLVAMVAILGGLFYVQQNRLQLCSRFEPLCDAETLTVTRAQQCSAIRDCGAWICLADYQVNYPNGRYKAVIDRIFAEKGGLCPTSIDLHNAYTPSADTSHANSSTTDASNTDTSADNSSDDPPRRHRRRLRRCRPGSTSPACLRRFRQQQQSR